jgi:hypothetical protein
MERSLVGGLTLIVLFLTGVVLLFYTRETHLLRREAQLQTELQNRPFISLIAEPEPRFKLVNVGKGLATNITIADTNLPGGYRLRAQPITHLAPGQETWLTLIPLMRGPDGEFVPLPIDRTLARRKLAEHGAELRIGYRSVVGKPYENVISVLEASDDFPDGPRVTVV